MRNTSPYVLLYCLPICFNFMLKLKTNKVLIRHIYINYLSVFQPPKNTNAQIVIIDKVRISVQMSFIKSFICKLIHDDTKLASLKSL